MKLTKLEKKVYNFIEKNTCPEDMDMVDINDLVKEIGESAKVLRGVISSLVKKDLIEVEEFDNGFDKPQFFYWMRGAF